MKRALLFLVFICAPWVLLGQKKGISYQAVILDPTPLDIPGNPISGQPLQKGKVSLRFTIGNAAGLDYVEIQQTETDEFGLINVMIGEGNTNVSLNSNASTLPRAKFNSFDAIIWDENQKNLAVGVSFDGGKTFSEVSNQRLSFSPYALYAEAVEYKNVREAPKKLSQFANDSGYLIPKDLDPISESLSQTNKTIRTNQLVVDQNFALVNQHIFSLSDSIQTNSRTIAKNTYSISDIEKKLVDVNGQISETKNESQANLNRLSSNINGLQSQIFSTNNALSNLASTYEIVENKSTATDLGNANPSDQLYPTQKAIKTYVDTKVADLVGGSIADATTLAPGKIQLAGDLGGTAVAPTVPGLSTKENISNKSISVGEDANSDSKYPSVKAVKTYVDQATQGIALQANLDAKANSSDVNAALGTKENASNKSNNSALGNSEELFPTQKAVKTYVDNQVANGIVSDADASTKGKIQLTGDLGGTAASPTVPGLALKANAADVTSALLLKANAVEVTTALSVKANTTDVTNALALKANASDLTNAISGKEEISNKSTSAALGTSDVLYPSQKAVKTYVDATLASGAPDADASTKGKIQLAGDLGGTAASPTVPGLALKANASDVTSALALKANASDVTSALSLKANSSDVTNGLALKAPINNPTFTGTVGGIDKSMVGLANIDNTSDANKPISSATQTALNLKANTSDVTSALSLKANGSDVTTALALKANTSDVSTALALKANASDVSTALALKANTTDIASDLALKANTADVTSALADKENSSNKSTSATLGTSDVLYPSQKAVKTYVDAQVASGAPDADASTKGKIQLAGDLGGTAASPTVPGLALKANASDVTSALSLKANASDVTSALNLKANASDVTSGLALKAPINNPTFTGTVGGIDKSMVGLANIDNTSDANKPISSATQTALNLKANTSDVTSALSLKANGSDVTTALALKANASDVTTALALKANSTDIASDLALKANTADVTSALADKENSSNKSTSATLGTSDVLYPSQKAVKTYVDATLASGAPDADASTKGKIQLAGDLGGTAASPTVPGLALKANASDVTTALALKANASDVTSGLALKAPINNPTFTGTVGGIDKSMVGLANIDNTSDANKPISIATQTALNLKANTTDVASDLALKANTADVTSALADKENSSNKSTSAALGTSDVLYPSQKAVKTYVDAQVASGAPDADANTKGKIKLAGDLGGTGSSASTPIISNSAINANKLAEDAVSSSKIANGSIATVDLADNLITTSKIASGAVATEDIANGAITDIKISSISGTKVSGNIPGNAANVTNTVAIGNGGTGATSQQAAITALTGTQSSGKYLRSNGTYASLTTIQAADIPTLNQNTTGSAATLGTPRNIYGNSFDGSSNLNQIIASTFGGTGNGYTKFSGPSSSEKTFTLPNSNASILTSAATVTVAQGGTGSNTLASNQVLLGNGTNAIQTVAPGNSGNVLTSNGSTWISASPTNSNNITTHAIGDSYGGGIVFYVYDGGTHGLIAAVKDQSPGIDWNLGTGYETRAKANGIGAGFKNTSLIIASEVSQRKSSQSDGNSRYGYNGQEFAATICNEFYASSTDNSVETTFGDWYLPSKYELNLLYLKRTTVGNFSSDKYWSSTEYDSDNAWVINFGTRSGSAEATEVKTNGARVRAIRAF